MTEQKQSKIPSFASMRKLRSRPKSSNVTGPSGKPSSLTGECSSGGAGDRDKRVRAGIRISTTDMQAQSAVEVFSSPSSLPVAEKENTTEKKITDYVLGPLQMHCLREFAAGRCDRLEITPAYKVPFIEGVSIGRSSENRARPAAMRCERRIYSRGTGAFAYISLRVIGSELRASRCSATIEGELGTRYEDGEDSGVF